eukprot:ANDGO_07437.mRNA.1 LRR receptor-like serine/threonine-protein kinase FLS2
MLRLSVLVVFAFVLFKFVACGPVYSGRIGLLPQDVLKPLKTKVFGGPPVYASSPSVSVGSVLDSTIRNITWWSAFQLQLNSATFELFEDSVFGHVFGLIDHLSIPLNEKSSSNTQYSVKSSKTSGFDSYLKSASESVGSQRFVHSVDMRNNVVRLLSKSVQSAPARSFDAVSHAPDCAVLVDLYTNTSGRTWRPLFWGDPLPSDFSKDCCSLGLGGFTCDSASGRITSLDLSANQLDGSLPESLSQLEDLRDIQLQNNNLHGGIPVSLGLLSKLRKLVLSFNNFTGPIPVFLGKLSHLSELELNSNLLNGSIPVSLGNLVQLTSLLLHDNQFSGSVPASLGNLSRLLQLDLSSNELSGEIPASISNLTLLVELSLQRNQLTGQIPASLGRLSKLEVLELYVNQFSGSIPETFGMLSKLRVLIAFANHLTGPIPASLGNLTHLEILALYDNHMTGEIPHSLGNLLNLTELYLHRNQLTGQLPSSLGNLLKLTLVDLSSNQLCGRIQDSLGCLRQLTLLSLSSNQFSDEIPESLGNLSQLHTLDLSANQLTGSIPNSLRLLSQLVSLYLSSNRLIGDIPESLGMLSQLLAMDLSSNLLNGTIPESLGNLRLLEELQLYSNQLSGSVPSSLGSLSALVHLDLSSNQLSGPLPSTLSDLSRLEYLDLSSNLLNGTLPASLNKNSRLKTLYLNSNQLSGPIVSTIGGLSNLLYLDLHSNQLSGPIPDSLGKLSKLQSVDLSYNQLSGPISCDSIGSSLTSLNFQGNGLSGAIPDCFCTQRDLTFVYMGSNMFQSFPNCSLPSVIQMDLSNNQISSFPFDLISSFSSMTSLDLSHNHLGSLFPVNVFLGGLPLRSLSLAFNSFVDEFPIFACNYLVPDETHTIVLVNGISGLESLDLSGNVILGLPGVVDYSTRNCEMCVGLGYPSLTDLKLENVSFGATFPSFAYSPYGLVNVFCNFPPLSFFDFLPYLPGLVSLDVSSNDLSVHLDFVLSLSLLSEFDVRSNPHARRWMLSITNQQRFSFVPSTSYPYSTNMTCLQSVVDHYLIFQADPSFFDYENCVCRSGYYGKPPNCQRCMANAECSFQDEAQIPFGNMSLAYAQSGNVLADPGYYASPPVTWLQMMNNESYPKSIEICAQSGTDLTPCQATQDRPCKAGYEGRLCAGCSPGNFRAGERCIECPSSEGLIIFAAVVFLVALSLLLWSFFVGSSSSGLVKVIVFFWQALFFIRAPMSQSLYVFSNSVSTTSMLSVAGPECFFKHWDYYTNYTFTVTAPIFAVLIVGLLWMFGMAWIFIRRLPRSAWKLWIDRCRRSAIFLYVFLFMSAISTVLAPLSCATDPGDGKKYMLFYPDQQCLPLMQAVSSGVLLIYAILVPGSLSFFVWRSGVLSKNVKPDTRRMYVYSLLFGSYKDNRRWWELVITIRRILFVVAYVTIPRLSEHRTMLVAGVLVIAAILQSVASPYRRNLENAVEITSLGLLLVNLVCSVQSQVLGVQDVVGAGTIVFLLNVAFSLSIVSMLLFQFAARWRQRDRQISLDNLQERLLQTDDAEL